MKKLSKKKILVILIILVVFLYVYTFIHWMYIKSNYINCEETRCEEIKKNLHEYFLTKSEKLSQKWNISLFVDGSCYICDTKPDTKFFLVFERRSYIFFGGCLLKDILYDHNYLEKTDVISIRYPHDYILGFDNLFHSFIAKEAGKTYVVTVGSCDYDRIYEINIQK